jgi:hypothetical protein
VWIVLDDVPYFKRRNAKLLTFFHETNYGRFKPVNNAIINFNKNCHWFGLSGDMFQDQLKSFVSWVRFRHGLFGRTLLTTPFCFYFVFLYVLKFKISLRTISVDVCIKIKINIFLTLQCMKSQIYSKANFFEIHILACILIFALPRTQKTIKF